MQTSEIGLLPSQQMAKTFVDKYHLEMVAGILGKFGFGGLGEIAEGVSDPSNAIQFHGELAGMVAMIMNRLEEDHRARHIEGCSCSNFKSFNLAENRKESSESLSGGDDGFWKVDLNASTDGQLPDIVLHETTTSENLDSGHEAEVQSGDGAERPDDSGDW